MSCLRLIILFWVTDINFWMIDTILEARRCWRSRRLFCCCRRRIEGRTFFGKLPHRDQILPVPWRGDICSSWLLSIVAALPPPYLWPVAASARLQASFCLSSYALQHHVVDVIIQTPNSSRLRRRIWSILLPKLQAWSSDILVRPGN